MHIIMTYLKYKISDPIRSNSHKFETKGKSTQKSNRLNFIVD